MAFSYSPQDKQTYHTSPITKAVVYVFFWGCAGAGIGSALYFKLLFTFIITPIVCAFLLVISALLVRGISFDQGEMILTYHLAGIKILRFPKPLDQIQEICIYGDGKYSHLRITYHPRPHLSDPHDEIQNRLFCSSPEAPAIPNPFPFEPGVGKRQFLHHISRRLSDRGHRVCAVTTPGPGSSWNCTLGMDHEPDQGKSRDTWMMD